MKKLLLCLSAVILTIPAFAWRCGPYRHWHHGCPRYYRGSGAADFWVGAGAGLVGGLIGGAIVEALKPDPPRVVVQPQPVVVQQPVVQQPVVQQPVVQQPVVQQQPIIVQQVALPPARTIWIPGRYVSKTQADGTVAQVWQPGHYEQR